MSPLLLPPNRSQSKIQPADAVGCGVVTSSPSVFVRWRHPIDSNTISVHGNEILIGSPSRDECKSLCFTGVFPSGTPQQQVYQTVCGDMIDNVVNGINVCMMAYGQSGTGKTYTMTGSPKGVRECDSGCAGVCVCRCACPGVCVCNPHSLADGIIPRFVNSLLRIKQIVNINMSAIEIYIEKIVDLLSPRNDDQQSLRLREADCDTYIESLTMVPLKSLSDFSEAFNRAVGRRSVGDTGLNQRSSRSHMLCFLTIETTLTFSKCCLVDLAGSERIGKSHATGVSLEEGKQINLSLTCLGSVIASLSANNTSKQFVRIRDSKLTRCLQPYLSGSAKLSIICTVDGSSENHSETVNTIQGFAARSLQVQIKPKVNLLTPLPQNRVEMGCQTEPFMCTALTSPLRRIPSLDCLSSQCDSTDPPHLSDSGESCSSARHTHHTYRRCGELVGEPILPLKAGGVSRSIGAVGMQLSLYRTSQSCPDLLLFSSSSMDEDSLDKITKGARHPPTPLPEYTPTKSHALTHTRTHTHTHTHTHTPTPSVMGSGCVCGCVTTHEYESVMFRISETRAYLCRYLDTNVVDTFIQDVNTHLHKQIS